MFQVKVQKNIARLTVQEKMTSGSQDVYVVGFEFSEEWAYLERTAVFKSGDVIINVLLDDTNQCLIPWEVLTNYDSTVSMGVFGTKDGHVVLPTIWAKTDAILEGVVTGVYPSEPTPDVYQQLLARLSSIEEGIESGAIKGESGATFTPSVSESGELTWTNDGGLPNPDPVNIKGNKGDTGDPGPQGPAGADGQPGSKGDKGDTGDVGPQGPAGKDGAKGDPGADGSPGPAGQDGKSAYQVAVDNGFTGTEQEWLDSLKASGVTEEQVQEMINTSVEQIELTPGPQGKPGVIFTPAVSESGELSWTNDGGLSNPAPINIKGAKGDKGDVGPQGPSGADSTIPGPKGDPGATFTPAVSEAGELTWTNNGGLPNPEPVNIMGPAGPAVGGANLTAGDGITIEGDAISVSLPTKAVTQSEYDALTEEEKQADVLHVIYDEAPAPEEFSFTWWSPKMMNASTPAPYAVSSTPNDISASGYGYPYQLFDGDYNTYWYSRVSNPWLLFDFGTDTKLVKGVSLAIASGYESFIPKSFDVEASNDGNTWVKILEGIGLTNTTGDQTFMFQQEEKYRYYRLINIVSPSNITILSEMKFLAADLPKTSSAIKYKDQPISGPIGKTGETGPAGKDATINGQNILEIAAGENVTIEQKDGVLTINAIGGGGSPALQSITITAPPDKTFYSPGDTFDPTGMIVIAMYEGGFSKQIVDYAISPEGPLADGTEKVTISYTENGIMMTADQPIATFHIYGVTWDGTSTTKWTRTDAATLFTDPVPYVAGATAYSSPFDNLMPWSGMVKEERAGGTMVAIPKFWYKLEQNTPGTPSSGMTIKIADKGIEGFSPSPAHMDRGDGKGERDVVYVGRYHCASDYKSKTGEKPKVNITRAGARTDIHTLGNNIWQMDFATRFTLWLLYLVEFADWNSQKTIGAGGGVALANGVSDVMPYHTGTMQETRDAYGVGVQYRNIEGLWDNGMDWCDGWRNGNNGINIITNPNDFSDSLGGISIGFSCNGYPSEFVVSNAAGFSIFYGSKAGGDTLTYSCDEYYCLSSNPTLYVGSYGNSDNFGLFYLGYGSTSSSDLIGTRLQELP